MIRVQRECATCSFALFLAGICPTTLWAAAGEYYLTGVASESATAGKHGMGRLDKVKVAGTDLRRELNLLDLIESTEFIRLSLKLITGGAEYIYDAVAGPPFTTSETFTGYIVEDSGAPKVRVSSSGWVFAWGIMPQVRDRWVSVAATGTAIAMETTDSNTQNIYIVDNDGGNSKAVITCLATGQTIELSDPTKYIHIEVCGNDATPWSITPANLGSDQVTFLTKAKDVATRGGWVAP